MVNIISNIKLAFKVNFRSLIFKINKMPSKNSDAIISLDKIGAVAHVETLISIKVSSNNSIG
jgi:hypothetical protein